MDQWRQGRLRRNLKACAALAAVCRTANDRGNELLHAVQTLVHLALGVVLAFLVKRDLVILRQGQCKLGGIHRRGGPAHDAKQGVTEGSLWEEKVPRLAVNFFRLRPATTLARRVGRGDIGAGRAGGTWGLLGHPQSRKRPSAVYAPTPCRLCNPPQADTIPSFADLFDQATLGMAGQGHRHGRAEVVHVPLGRQHELAPPDCVVGDLTGRPLSALGLAQAFQAQR